MKRICYAVLALVLLSIAFSPTPDSVSGGPECQPTPVPTSGVPSGIGCQPPATLYPPPTEPPVPPETPYPPPVEPSPDPYPPPGDNPTETAVPPIHGEEPAKTLPVTGWGEIYQLQSQFGLILLGGVFFGGTFIIARLGRRRR